MANTTELGLLCNATWKPLQPGVGVLVYKTSCNHVFWCARTRCVSCSATQLLHHHL